MRHLQLNGALALSRHEGECLAQLIEAQPVESRARTTLEMAHRKLSAAIARFDAAAFAKLSQTLARIDQDNRRDAATGAKVGGLL